MNLAAYLKANSARHQFIEKPTTHHADEASRASGIPITNIAKTIVFVDPEERPVIAVVRGDRMVSRHKLEACSGMHKLRIASDTLAEKVTGYPTGGIPPVGHRRRSPVFLDTEIASLGTVWCGGGTRTRLVNLATADIVRLAGATTCDISVPG
ncbi:MAG TPA: YbaK/EbsC family protein [Dehalococcoidia bacterium]|nr:YbaK/EbsC family protein [Dehalococcoidia bacterium]